MNTKPSNRFGRILTTLLLTFLVGISVSFGNPPSRKVGIAKSNGYLITTFSYRDAFTPKVKKKLRSGLPTQIIAQVILEAKQTGKGENKYWLRAIDITFDLWEEVYVVVLKDKHGKRRTKVKTIKEAINAAGILWRAKIARLKDIEPGTYRLRFVAEVNPVSKEMVRNIQQWISKPKEGRSGSQTGSNFFGTFVGRFVDKNIGQADQTVMFVSQWFKVGSK